MIGMKAFIVDVPTSPLSPAAALPVQIYIWADSPERGFAERTAAAIMVLLAFLIVDERPGDLLPPQVRTEMVAQTMNQMRDDAARGRDRRRPPATKMAAHKVNLWYGDKQALFDVNLEVAERQVTALIGPSGCGKSTFLRCLNRMNDIIDGCRTEGDIRLDGRDVYAPDVDVVQLRARVGMVFQKPNPFPKSIYDNVAYGPTIHGLARGKADMDEIVEAACAAPACGTRSRTGSTSPATASPAASSSACASRARSRSAPR